MHKNTLFILGDSTSMTVGSEPCMYPFLMAKKAAWPQEMTLVNCSQPGITSADACAFFFQHANKPYNTRGVVIHLGTCDSTSSEIKKGRYTWLRQKHNHLKNKLGLSPKRTRLHNRLLNFEWNNNLDLNLEKPESPSDFGYNLERIIKKCRARAIPVVLVRPKSNPFFLPGVGKGNFVFYSYLGIPAKISNRIKIPDMRFVEALSLSEQEKFQESAEHYKRILSEPDLTFSSPEYTLLVANNYAVAKAEAGNLTEAETLLHLLLKERGIRREIILYNLAQLARRKGDLAKHAEFLKNSYESDNSLYRIRAPYLEAIDRLGQKYSDIVSVIDLHSLINDECYVDHCHPLPAGQSIIADTMMNVLRDKKIHGTSMAAILNLRFNPEHAMGNFTEFYSYFRAYAELSPEKIKEERDRLRTTLSETFIGNEESILATAPEAFQNAIPFYLRHPLFSSMKEILRFGPEFPSDIGRFPEFFLIRHIIPYLKMHENDPELSSRFRSDLGVLSTSTNLSYALPEAIIPLISNNIASFNKELDTARIDTLLEKALSQLVEQLKNGNQVYERMKSTIFWYFRETLRYGSHSRYSMRYDFTSLQYIAESLAVAGILDRKLSLNKTQSILTMISWVEEAASIHKEFSQRFSLKENPRNLLQEYDRKLNQLLDKIQNREDSNVYTRNISILSR